MKWVIVTRVVWQLSIPCITEGDDATSGEEDTTADEDVGTSSLNKQQAQQANFDQPDLDEQEIIEKGKPLEDGKIFCLVTNFTWQPAL